MSDYFNLGPYSWPVTHRTEEAQTWFDRGLNWCYGYHHEEAISCWKTALDKDPACVMAHWGIAYATGPNYNMPWHLYDPKGRARTLAACYDAMQEAKEIGKELRWSSEQTRELAKRAMSDQSTKVNYQQAHRTA